MTVLLYNLKNTGGDRITRHALSIRKKGHYFTATKMVTGGLKET